MAGGTASHAPRVVFIADAADRRYETLADLLTEAGIQPVCTADVYLGMGEIACDSTALPLVVVLDLDRLDAAEMDFLPLARRILGAGALYLIGTPVRNARFLREATATGCRTIEATDAEEWVGLLLESHGRSLPAEADRAPTEPATERLERAAERVPRPTAPAARPMSEELPRPAGLAVNRIAVPPKPAHPPLRLTEPEPVPVVVEEETVVEPEAEPVVRSLEASAAPEPERHPVPWNPASNRPTRIPPGGLKPAAREIPANPTEDGDVELSREELDALLGRGETARARKQSL